MASNAQSYFSDFGLPHSNEEMDVDEDNSSGGTQQRIELGKGYFDDDDDGSDDLFGEKAPYAATCKSPKTKKIPRRLSDHNDTDADASEPSPTKKLRLTSLFGGPDEGMHEDEEVQFSKPPQGTDDVANSL